MGIVLIKLYHQQFLYSKNIELIKHFRMSTDQNQQNWAIHSTMHQNKQKYRQLGASLLLTSSFAHHKERANKQKKERLQTIVTNNIIYHHQVLKAKKINYQDNKSIVGPIDVSLSNIDQLKTHAKKLMDQKTTKLGKENSCQELFQDNRIATAESQKIQVENFRVNKKPNKRKIIKGRPQMYAVTKRRTFLRNLIQEQGQPKYLSRQESGRQKIKQLLNKNNLLKFISTTNQKSEYKNLYDNYQRHKTVEQVVKINEQKKKFNPHRTSLTMIRSCQKRNKFMPKLQETCDNEGGALKNYVFCLKKRRYSSIKTIQ